MYISITIICLMIWCDLAAMISNDLFLSVQLYLLRIFFVYFVFLRSLLGKSYVVIRT